MYRLVQFKAVKVQIHINIQIHRLINKASVL